MTAGPATTGAHKFGTVRTVLGDVPTERLGRCDYHEHLFQASPLLVGDELDDEQASRQEAESLRRSTHWLLEADDNDLTDRFLADVRDGLPDSHRQQPGVTALERQVMTSAFRKP
jgi:hypothetical protein